MTTIGDDIWGSIYRDHWRKDPHPIVFVREDGHENVVESIAGYFEAPRGEAEAAALAELSGRVLDLGCGVGAYALLLQEQGVEVVAIDASPGAIEVCRARGCRSARVMDLRDLSELHAQAGTFDAVICMGNTLGIHQSPETFPSFLAGLRRLVKPDGRLLAALVNPLDTDDPDHLAYHERNRARGRPPGLVRARIRYREELGEWWQLWLPTDEELGDVASKGGWVVESVAREGPARVWRLRSGAPPGRAGDPLPAHVSRDPSGG